MTVDAHGRLAQWRYSHKITCHKQKPMFSTSTISFYITNKSQQINNSFNAVVWVVIRTKIIPSDDYYYYFYVFVSLKLRWHKAHYEGTKAWMRFVCAVKKKAVKYYVCIYGIFRFGRTLKWCFKCISSEYVGFMATLEI